LLLKQLSNRLQLNDGCDKTIYRNDREILP
jgi:hypothetical protein